MTLPAVYPNPKSGIEFPYTFADSNPFLETIDVTKAAKAARKLLSRQYQDVLDLEGAADENPIRNWFRRNSGGDTLDNHHQTPPPSSGVAGGFASLVSNLVTKMREEKAAAAAGADSARDPPLVFGEKSKGPAFGAASETTVVAADSPASAATEDAGAENDAEGFAARKNQKDLSVSTAAGLTSVDGLNSPSLLAPSTTASPSPSTSPSDPESEYSPVRLGTSL